MFGVNAFYRDIQDLIETVNTGEPSSTALDDFEDEVEEFLDENPGANDNTPGYPQFDPDSFVYTARNVGDGYVYGVEFDLLPWMQQHKMPKSLPFDLKRTAHGGFKTIVEG